MRSGGGARNEQLPQSNKKLTDSHHGRQGIRPKGERSLRSFVHCVESQSSAALPRRRPSSRRPSFTPVLPSFLLHCSSLKQLLFPRVAFSPRCSLSLYNLRTRSAAHLQSTIHPHSPLAPIPRVFTFCCPQIGSSALDVLAPQPVHHRFLVVSFPVPTRLFKVRRDWDAFLEVSLPVRMGRGGCRVADRSSY
jgi:hypothetical protein